MCGITGAFAALEEKTLQQMVQSLSHRGPDHASHASIDEVHLGHTRLSIIDLSIASHQPLWDSQQKACIVFNGEIYNYKTLRQELIELGYQFHSKGDAEVIVNLYLHYGVDFLKKLDGIFSFALWDTMQNQLLVARDGFGVKPLYFTENSNGFYFASELKTLLLIPSIKRELNYNALFRTIVFLWSPGPETIINHLYKLKPGHYLIVKEKKIVKQEAFYDWPVYNPESISTKKAAKRIQVALQESVSSQMVSDVPVGAFLSGGLDSSLIVAMMKQANIKEFECFTIKSVDPSEKNDGFIDDLPYAHRVAQHLNVKLNVVDAKPDMITQISTMLYHLDEPQADPAPLNVMLICEQARQKGIKVLFSGAGGDDIFTGYHRHFAVTLEKYWIHLPSRIRSLLQQVGRKMPRNNTLLRRFSKLFSYAAQSENERLLSYFYWMNPQEVYNLLTKEVQDQLNENPMASLLNELQKRPETNRLEKLLYLERRYFLVDHNLNYTDKMSMAKGIEVRVPFLNHAVVDTASKLHTKLKQQGATGKWILKKMAQQYLPKSIIYRQKTGFGAPLRRWLKSELAPMVEEVLSEEALTRRGLFNPKAVHQLIEHDRCGKRDYSYPIFALLCIELWCRIFIDGDAHSLEKT